MANVKMVARKKPSSQTDETRPTDEWEINRHGEQFKFLLGSFENFYFYFDIQ